MNRLTRIFLDTDMRCQHDGLKKLAVSQKVNLDALADGEHVIFINSKRNRIKMYSSRGVLSYLRLKKGTIALETLREIPSVFGGKLSASYDKVLTQKLKKKLHLN